MSYERLAYVYDSLMANVPYASWLQFLSDQKKRHQVHGNRILDLACGTGELSIRLAKEGFSVTGVDLSSDMLMVANEKAMRTSVNLDLYEQDMSELDGLGTFDLITIFCDSLNYLQTPEQVKKTFLHVHRHLDDNGLFLFDVHSPFQIEHIYMDQTFASMEEEVAYIWNCFPGDHEYSVEHELTLFILDEKTNQYERIEELHKQRTYPIEEYIKWLDEAGFSVSSVTADFSSNTPAETSERIFFTCKKK